jgi:hypothetical protein
MPNRWAVATGNWSNTATWNNGAVLGIPTGSDDVFISGSTLTVTIDQDITVLSLNNVSSGSGAGAIAAGGRFITSGSRNITANVNGNSTAICLTVTGSNVTSSIVGNIISGSGATNIFALNVVTINSLISISGSLRGSATANGISTRVSASNSVINITGSMLGGTNTSTYGLLATGTSNTYNITGSLVGGTAAYAVGMNIVGTSNTVRVTGTATGGSAALGNNASGILVGSSFAVSQLNLIVSGTVTGGGVATHNGIAIDSVTNPYTASITGNIVGGTAGAGVALLSSTTGTGSVTVVGSVTGGSGAAGLSSAAVNNTTITITGSVLAGSGASAHGISLTGTSNTLTISGSAISGSTAGASNSGVNIGGTTNTVRVVADVVGGTGTTSYGVSMAGTTNNLIVTGSLLCPSLGSGVLTSNGATNMTASFLSNQITPTLLGTGYPLYITTTIPALINIVSSGIVGGAAANAHAINLLGTTNCVMNITGSILGGLGSAALGMQIGGSVNTVNMTGSVIAGLGGSGISTGAANSIINLNGTSTGNSTVFGISSNTTSTITATEAIGASALPTFTGAGISNTGAGRVIVNTARGLIGAGISNTSTGTVRVVSAVASDSASAVTNTGTGIVSFQNMTFSSNGRLPITGLSRLTPSANNFISCSLESGGSETLIDINNVTIGMPSPSDVRLDTLYNFNLNRGIMAVPSASNVLLGIPVDTTVGTATLTTSSFRDAVWSTNINTLTGSTGTIGNIAIQTSTVDSVGDQLVALL